MVNLHNCLSPQRALGASGRCLRQPLVYALAPSAGGYPYCVVYSGRAIYGASGANIGAGAHCRRPFAARLYDGCKIARPSPCDCHYCPDACNRDHCLDISTTRDTWCDRGWGNTPTYLRCTACEWASVATTLMASGLTGVEMLKLFKKRLKRKNPPKRVIFSSFPVQLHVGSILALVIIPNLPKASCSSVMALDCYLAIMASRSHLPNSV